MGSVISSPEKMQNPPHKNPDGTSGAVLVVGGGIAGIQVSLDMAESGYRVYLVENDYAIGGTMAQLDKTFPQRLCHVHSVPKTGRGWQTCEYFPDDLD